MSDKIYCYPDTDILKNKKNIRDKEKLLQAEISYTSARLADLQMNPVKGRFGFNHLCEIHRRIFQDLYAWAGKPRTVNISKGNLFCLVQNIPGYAESIFSHYYEDCMAAKDDPDKFVTTLAGHYADVNALHPFREGNGRSQREFARELCLQCGYVLDLTETSHKEMLTASIESFDKADNAKLEAVLKKAVIPLSSYPVLEKRLQSDILILSKNDVPDKKSQTASVHKTDKRNSLEELAERLEDAKDSQNDSQTGIEPQK